MDDHKNFNSFSINKPFFYSKFDCGLKIYRNLP